MTRLAVVLLALACARMVPPASFAAREWDCVSPPDSANPLPQPERCHRDPPQLVAGLAPAGGPATVAVACRMATAAVVGDTVTVARVCAPPAFWDSLYRQLAPAPSLAFRRP